MGRREVIEGRVFIPMRLTEHREVGILVNDQTPGGNREDTGYMSRMIAGFRDALQNYKSSLMFSCQTIHPRLTPKA